MLPHNVLCTAAESSLCAPAQHRLAEVSLGGQYLETLGELLMHLGYRNILYAKINDIKYIERDWDSTEILLYYTIAVH